MWVYASLAATLIGFIAGWQINGIRLNAEIAQLHATWNEAYAHQAKITSDKEHELNELNTKVETDNATKEKTINDAHAENLRLAADIERLQHATGSRGGTMPKTRCSCERTGNAAPSGLSDESISLLVQMAREADEATKYASTCHDWAVGVAKELHE
jgi:hypothetical protein